MSKGTIIGTVAFVMGAAIGSATTYFVTKKKYDELVQQEIDSVREVFSKHYESKPIVEKAVEKIEEAHEIAEEAKNKPELNEYVSKIEKHDYSSYSQDDKSEKKTIDTEKPYVISPEEFGELEDYTVISLTYFADKVLVDELYEMVEDVENTVGFNSLNEIGKYEDDAVHVRNDRLQADYEILLDLRKYTDVMKNRAKLPEVV